MKTSYWLIIIGVILIFSIINSEFNSDERLKYIDTLKNQRDITISVLKKEHELKAKALLFKADSLHSLIVQIEIEDSINKYKYSHEKIKILHFTPLQSWIAIDSILSANHIR